MKKAVRMMKPAEQEMFDAAVYYELQVAGLGQAFLDRMASAVADIGENPERWPIVMRNIRRRLVHRFPYGLFYRVDADEVVVLAVAHLHRHPTYWAKRL
ncbi:MAG TPA: type II toxin-antitoxin system RelE/ParE family toxin [Desulfobacteraceae bacterium]|nr:type II toxin-antitoxin system RelE/ParE family toxin [Desulfobacteraceae bacterium]